MKRKQIRDQLWYVIGMEFVNSEFGKTNSKVARDITAQLSLSIVEELSNQLANNVTAHIKHMQVMDLYEET